MSNLSKQIHEYRIGDDWKNNFTHINYPNIEASLRSILTKAEPVHQRDRLGNITYTDKTRVRPISLDEKIFRIAVLIDTQMRERAEPLYDGITPGFEVVENNGFVQITDPGSSSSATTPAAHPIQSTNKGVGNVRHD